MEEIFYMSIVFVCITRMDSVIPQENVDEIDSKTCCNGTMGYAALPMIPCSALQCCNESETVAIYPVNHALGYKFLCMPKHAFMSSKCYRTGEEVVSSNTTAVKYVPKICCPRLKFQLRFNMENVALTVYCIKR